MASLLTRTRDFTAEVTEEVKKVTWPDVPQLKDATRAILIFVAIVAAIIFLMDQGVGFVLKLVMNFFAR